MDRKPWMASGNTPVVTGTPAAVEHGGVADRVVAQRVLAGGQHQGRRQVGMVGGEDRADPGVVGGDAGGQALRQVEPAVPVQRPAAQHRRVGVLVDRRLRTG